MALQTPVFGISGRGSRFTGLKPRYQFLLCMRLETFVSLINRGSAYSRHALIGRKRPRSGEEFRGAKVPHRSANGGYRDHIISGGASGPVSALVLRSGSGRRALPPSARWDGSLKNRHDATMLAQLDDRMLSDIGLTRSDLRDAYSEPLWRDPTAYSRQPRSRAPVNRPGDHARRAVAGAGRDRRDGDTTGAAALAGALRTLKFRESARPIPPDRP